MKLFLDVGNTAAKWRLREGRSVCQRGLQHGRDWPALADAISRDMGLDALSQLYVASVAGREADEALARSLQQAFDVEPGFYYSPAEDAGIVNSYEEPGRLGVDRWLALVEARHLTGSAAIVVDCGSALTIDAVDSQGRHVGGYIVPGLRMLESSLLAKTASVRFPEAMDWSTLDPGTSTKSCVHNGTMRMTVAFVTETVVALQNLVQDTCPVFVTGGDAEHVLAWLPGQPQHVPDMVLDGLERVTAGY